MLTNNSKTVRGIHSKYLSRRKEGLQWEEFAEKEVFKPGRKSEWVMEYQITVSMTVGR